MSYDLIVLGSGPGGYVAAIRASQLGMKVAVVERESLGGVCLNWGCIPTKALLKSAQVFDYLQHAQEYGITTGDPGVDFPAVIARSREAAESMSKGVQFLMRKNKIEVVEGYGVLKPGRRLEVTAADGSVREMRARHLIIATGARARELPALPPDGRRIIDYRKAMTLEEMPASMAVVGAGAIGVEFAYFYHTLGCKVTLIEYLDRLMPNEDRDISRELEKIFRKKGMEILTAAEVTNSRAGDKGVRLLVSQGGETHKIEADVVLSAVGVTPNTGHIGLEQAGIATDGPYVATDAFYRTNMEGYYAIGDVLRGPALAHVASAEGIICVEKIAGLDPEPLNYGNLPACTYCQPEIASVGMTEEKAREAGYEVKVGKFPFTASGKATAAGAREGFAKVIFDAKYGEFLGAHLIGSSVTEMIAEVVVARNLETTGHEIVKSVHPHPTMSEALMEAAAAAYGEVIHL